MSNPAPSNDPRRAVKIDKWDVLSLIAAILALTLFAFLRLSIPMQAAGFALVLAAAYAFRIHRRKKLRVITGVSDDLSQLLSDSTTRLNTLIAVGLIVILFARIFRGTFVL